MRLLFLVFFLVVGILMIEFLILVKVFLFEILLELMKFGVCFSDNEEMVDFFKLFLMDEKFRMLDVFDCMDSGSIFSGVFFFFCLVVCFVFGLFLGMSMGMIFDLLNVEMLVVDWIFMECFLGVVMLVIVIELIWVVFGMMLSFFFCGVVGVFMVVLCSMYNVNMFYR